MAVAWIDRFPEARDYIVGMKFKPPPRYDAGVFVDLHDQPFAGSLVGNMLPQPVGELLLGGQGRLDDLIGPGFGLITMGEETATFVEREKSRLFPDLSPAIARLDTRPDNTVDLSLSDRRQSAPFMAHRDQILLVRPDRYVAAAFWPEDYPSVEKALARQLKEGRNETAPTDWQGPFRGLDGDRDLFTWSRTRPRGSVPSAPGRMSSSFGARMKVPIILSWFTST